MALPTKKIRKPQKPQRRSRVQFFTGITGAGTGGLAAFLSPYLSDQHHQRILQALAPSITVAWIWSEPYVLDLLDLGRRWLRIRAAYWRLGGARKRLMSAASSEDEKARLSELIKQLESAIFDAQYGDAIVATINDLVSDAPARPQKRKRQH
jgi:hypothetical protein